MATADIQNAAFHDDDKAREALEAIRWPDGPFCPHCGNSDQGKIAKGQGKAHRPGLYYLRRVQRPVYRHGRHGHGAQQDSAVQVAVRDAPDGREQEGHERAPAPAHARRDLQDGLVPLPSHPRSHDADHARPSSRATGTATHSRTAAIRYANRSQATTRTVSSLSLSKMGSSH